MTTPDTLAELIAKWRKIVELAEEYENKLSVSDAKIHRLCLDSFIGRIGELEAALDALAERWEELADSAECCEKEAIRLNYPPEKIETHARAKHNLRLCVAELRGRGADKP